MKFLVIISLFIIAVSATPVDFLKSVVAVQHFTDNLINKLEELEKDVSDARKLQFLQDFKMHAKNLAITMAPQTISMLKNKIKSHDFQGAKQLLSQYVKNFASKAKDVGQNIIKKLKNKFGHSEGRAAADTLNQFLQEIINHVKGIGASVAAQTIDKIQGTLDG
ncbi:hypothetical protein SNEBB_010970 [Seison nebaliae]|nr:hypothetical protein SNEBB_010970 [Seison nebaliae]